LVRIGRGRAVVAGVADAVAVDICLVGVEGVRAIVDCVAQAVAVAVILPAPDA